MIAVGVCPTGSINLAGWDAHSAECGNGKGGFFATTTVGSAHGGEGRTGACIRGGISHLLVTPVVDFKHCIVHREGADTFLEFFIKHTAALVHILIVHANGKHKVEKLTVGNLFPPGHFLTCLEGIVDIHEVEIT